MTESENFHSQFGYRWVTIVALATVSAFQLLKFYSSMASGTAQASFVGWCGVVMFFSPLSFLLLPRSCFNRPALLLLTWWPIPISTCWIAFQQLILENYNGFFLGLASLWAMFVPVIVGGIRREREHRKRN